jgi:hypothetical protein
MASHSWKWWCHLENQAMKINASVIIVFTLVVLIADALVDCSNFIIPSADYPYVYNIHALSDDSVNYTTANSRCQSFGGSMAIIYDNNTLSAIRPWITATGQAQGTIYSSLEARIGLTKNTSTGIWKWSDGVVCNVTNPLDRRCFNLFKVDSSLSCAAAKNLDPQIQAKDCADNLWFICQFHGTFSHWFELGFSYILYLVCSAQLHKRFLSFKEWRYFTKQQLSNMPSWNLFFILC